MIYELNQNISKMDEVIAQAQVLIPVLQAARAELGEERANRLILGALRTWCQDRYRQILASLPGTPQEKWDAIKDIDMARTRKNDVEYEVLKWEPETVEYDVSRCKYADIFRELGEPELGAILACDPGFYIMQVTSPEVEYARTQSIMKGDCYCDVRWRLKRDRQIQE